MKNNILQCNEHKIGISRLLFRLMMSAMICFIVQSKCFAGEKNLIYKSYNVKTGKITRRSYINIKDLPLDEKMFIHKSEREDRTVLDVFKLDQNFMTSQWSRTCADEDTHYIGEKNGKTLIVKGTFRGKSINKEIALDDKPFYGDPKFNLSKFALSDQKNVKFWMLRKDTLSKMIMQAKKRGEESILVNGKEMEVVRVYFSAMGIREKYYKHVYYFRKSDGLFVKKATSNGLMADLISEKDI